ncbi:MAG: hypothetical protein EORIYHIE_002818 [Candidatus Fervidibacter sp.]
MLSAVVKPKFSAMQEHCHTKLLATRYSLFAIRYSPFATRCCFNIRQSLFAAVSRLADLPISRFADKIRLGRNLALPRFSLLTGGSLCRDDCQPSKSMGLQNERWLKPDLSAKLCRPSTSNDDLSAFKDFLRPFMSNGFKEGSHQ